MLSNLLASVKQVKLLPIKRQRQRKTQLLYYFTIRLAKLNFPPLSLSWACLLACWLARSLSLQKVGRADMSEHFMAASNFARSSVGLEALICFINSGDKATQELRNRRAPFSPSCLPSECIMHFFLHIVLKRAKKSDKTWINIWGKKKCANARLSLPVVFPEYWCCDVDSP